MFPLASIVDLNIDLLFVGIAVAAISILGFLIYYSNPKSETSRTFFLFSIATMLWGLSNYFEYKFTTIPLTLWALRIHLFIAIWYALLYFRFCFVFPNTTVQFPRWYRAFLIPLVAVISIINLSPLTFSGISELAPAGQVTNPDRGFGLPLFATVAFSLLSAGLYVLVKKTIRSVAMEKKQHVLVLAAMASLAMLIFIFNVLLPVVFNILSFIPLAALFVLPFIALISYAIYKHHLFNLKVFATGVLVFILAALTFIEVVFSDTSAQLLLRGIMLFLILGAGILLIRSVMREIEQREFIEKQEKDLEIANRQQESLLHFISHEIKGYLTKSEAVFAGIMQGDFGKVDDGVEKMSESALREVRKGVETVMDILDASNLKKGTVVYSKKFFDFRNVVDMSVADLAPAAQEKNLTITTHCGDGPYTMIGDEEKLHRHVVRNLIDNAIKYTPSGNIEVTLERTRNSIRLTVKDSGVGIAPDDMERLFTEGGRGKNSIKINTHSTGFGLYIAKQIVEAHKGRIWAESEGVGKGSRFIVEFSTI